MPTVTLTATATVTLDGQVVSSGGTFTCDVDQVVEQTIEVETTYVSIGPSGYTDFSSFYVVVNKGNDDATIRFAKGNTPATTARYLFVSVPAGGHAVIPYAFFDETDTTAQGLNALSARAVNTTTRLYVIMGRHA